MKIMITSFGLEHSLFSQAGQDSMFHHMPPVSFRTIGEVFMPDYELLLLCDRVIMDEASFDRLVHGRVAAYSHVCETFQALKSEGRIELTNFSSTLRPHANLLGRMVDYDIRSLDQWVDPLRESLTLWQTFSQRSLDLVRSEREQRFNPFGDHYVRFGKATNEVVHPMRHHDAAFAARVSMLVTDALESSRKRRRKEYRDALRDVLRAYLIYVDANLILSNQLEVGFHDWLDFTPFYTAKFLSVGRDGDIVHDSRTQLERLFTIPFPELAITNPRALVKALNDKRLEDLRRLVAEAADGRVEFDTSFAKSVLGEVFRSSERAKRVRRVVGYVTLPIGLIPWVGTAAQKIIEEVVGIPIERKFRQKHRWFYMLSDLVESPGEPA